MPKTSIGDKVCEINILQHQNTELPLLILFNDNKNLTAGNDQHGSYQSCLKHSKKTQSPLRELKPFFFVCFLNVSSHTKSRLPTQNLLDADSRCDHMRKRRQRW